MTHHLADQNIIKIQANMTQTIGILEIGTGQKRNSSGSQENGDLTDLINHRVHHRICNLQKVSRITKPM